MCSPARWMQLPWRSLLVAAAAGTVGATLSAQNREEIRERVDRLVERSRAAAERLDSVRAARPAVSLDTTTSVAHLRFVTHRDNENVRNVVRVASDSLRAVLRGDTVILGDRTLLVSSEWSWDAAVAPLRSAGEKYVRVTGETLAEQAASVVASVRQLVWWDLDSALKTWVGSDFTFDSVSPQFTSAHWEFAVSPWRVVRACPEGDLHACRLVLGLDPIDDPATTLFTAEERRTRVEGNRSYAGRRDEGERECVDRGIDSVCIRILRERPWLARLELTGISRGTFLQVALGVGREGALHRLITNDTLTIGMRLALAAGVPTDSLIRLWRRRLEDARPESAFLARPSAWGAFVWVLVLAVAATRSSRWRAA